MPRKKGFSKKKVHTILSVLMKEPEGIWLRELARKTKLGHGTVIRYIEMLLNPLLTDQTLATKRPLIRFIKLKPEVAGRMETEKDIQELIKKIEDNIKNSSQKG